MLLMIQNNKKTFLLNQIRGYTACDMVITGTVGILIKAKNKKLKKWHK
jgi:hypothetical protein